MQKINSLSRILLITAAVALIISLFVPIWAIYLDAPQYPEGLSLRIWANKLAGDVDIINGLNHYIGMKTLHTDDFKEFVVLPYIIAGFALLFVIVAILGRKKWLYAALAAFVLFGILAMVDFWMWEYDYGHNLDPNAAIRVPGMAYQPPLIGFKQLLNFGAYSIPDIGGWLFVTAGLLLVVATIIEVKRSRKIKISTTVPLLLLPIFFIASCNNQEPEPIVLHKDACESCKMSISDGKFGAELVTKKGRIYKFDDLGCMMSYSAASGQQNEHKYFVSDFANDNTLIDATTAWYVRNEELRSPMGGNTAAFSTKEAAQKQADNFKIQPISWDEASRFTQQH